MTRSYFIKLQKKDFKQKAREKVEISEIFPISNLFKNSFNNLMDNSDYSFNNRHPIESKQIHILSNNIPSPKKRKKELN